MIYVHTIGLINGTQTSDSANLKVGLLRGIPIVSAATVVPVDTDVSPNALFFVTPNGPCSYDIIKKIGGGGFTLNVAAPTGGVLPTAFDVLVVD